MATCKGACLPALSPDALFTIVSQVVHSQVTATTDPTVTSPSVGPVAGQGGGTDRTVTLAASPVSSANGTTHDYEHLRAYSAPAETITATELSQRSIRAVAIMLAESGGIPNAYNTNVGGSAPGSHDRGLPQWNDQSFSWITDIEAFAPPESVSLMYYVSKHFTDWSPWHGSRGLDNGSDPYKTAAAADKARTGIAVPTDDPVTGAAVSVATFSASDLWPLLVKIAGVLTSGAFWRRFGVGALGVLLIVVAVVMFVRS